MNASSWWSCCISKNSWLKLIHSHLGLLTVSYNCYYVFTLRATWCSRATHAAQGCGCIYAFKLKVNVEAEIKDKPLTCCLQLQDIGINVNKLLHSQGEAFLLCFEPPSDTLSKCSIPYCIGCWSCIWRYWKAKRCAFLWYFLFKLL